ncbi:MAG: uL22 family ribosomal protein [Nanoarchaeota archaeon]|nr:uL22 family ribosomal protein [Nanoarchaeota archaeon]
MELQETKKNIEKVDEKSKVDESVEIKNDKEVGETKKPVKKNENVKKDVAVANGFSLRISPKQSVYICKAIRGKSPEVAIMKLNEVIKGKRAIPMAGLEVGHRKGKGLAGGRFPKNACKAIIEIVKQAGANAIVAGIENPVITIVKSDRASAPYRRAGRKAKRTHIHVEIRNREAGL